MLKPQILSLGCALPPFRYTQREIFDSLHYPNRFWPLFRDGGIGARHFCVPFETLRRLTFQEQQQEYRRQAIILSKQAIMDCLDKRPSDIGCLVYASCTGIAPGPTIGDYLVKEMGFAPNTRVVNIGMQGCEGGGFPGLSTAVDFTVANGKPSLVVATELCGLTYYPEPDGHPIPDNDYQLVRADAIFGEASSAALVGYDDDWRHPTVVDQESHTDTAYIDDLGYRWVEGRLMALMSRRVPQIAPLVVKPAVDAVLARQGLAVGDIRWWVVHAAGLAVISNIQKSLGIPKDKMELSLEVLQQYGNCSSATVGLVGKHLMSKDIQKGDWAAAVTVGPAMRGGVSLLKFSNSKEAL